LDPPERKGINTIIAASMAVLHDAMLRNAAFSSSLMLFLRRGILSPEQLSRACAAIVLGPRALKGVTTELRALLAVIMTGEVGVSGMRGARSHAISRGVVIGGLRCNALRARLRRA